MARSQNHAIPSWLQPFSRQDPTEEENSAVFLDGGLRFLGKFQEILRVWKLQNSMDGFCQDPGWTLEKPSTNRGFH